MSTITIGQIVDCVIPAWATPNGKGNPIPVPDRTRGTVVRRDEYGLWEVQWPNGFTSGYEGGLLVPSKEVTR